MDVPRTVDHHQRRSQLAESLVRVAAREGLHAVTMRAVAAEAGFSLRLVQYYFQNKAQLTLGVLEHLEHESNQRWTARMATLPSPAPARALIEAFFDEALPTDERSHAFQLVGASYSVLAMTDPELADQPFITGIDRLEGRLAEVLEQAKAEGEIGPDVDPAAEAARLVALNHGLGTSVLLGQRSAESAKEIVHYHLDRMFPGT